MAPLEAAQDHRSFNLPENENACTFCGAEVASREGMESHILFKHLKAALTCSPCGLKLKNKSNSSKHLAEKHKDAEPSSCISIQVGRYHYFSASSYCFYGWNFISNIFPSVASVRSTPWRGNSRPTWTLLISNRWRYKHFHFQYMGVITLSLSFDSGFSSINHLSKNMTSQNFMQRSRNQSSRQHVINATSLPQAKQN